MNLFTYIYSVAIAWCVVCAGVVHAGGPDPAPEVWGSQIEHYLNTLKTFKADFTQAAAGQALAQEGVFYVQRPHKFLWHYTSPDEQKIIATGTHLFYVDDNGQATQLSQNNGLAAFLTQPKISLTGESTTLERVDKDGDMLKAYLTVTAEDAPVQDLTLYFARTPKLQLTGIATTDQLGVQTYVQFTNVQENIALDKQLFTYDHPFLSF